MIKLTNKELIEKLESKKITFDFQGHIFYTEKETEDLVDYYIEDIKRSDEIHQGTTQNLNETFGKNTISLEFSCTKCGTKHNTWELLDNNTLVPLQLDWSEKTYNSVSCEAAVTLPDTSDIEMLFSIPDIKQLILDKKEEIKDLIIKLKIEDGYTGISARIEDNMLIKFYPDDLSIVEDEYGNSLITDLTNINKVSNLFEDYDGLVELFKVLGVKPLDANDNPKDIMLKFATESAKALYESDNKQIIKITDFDDDYYIASIISEDKYNKNSYMQDASLSSFKSYSENYIVFQLDDYPKNRFNVCGGDALYKSKNIAWFRSVLLSFYFFGNFER